MPIMKDCVVVIFTVIVTIAQAQYNSGSADGLRNPNDLNPGGYDANGNDHGFESGVAVPSDDAGGYASAGPALFEDDIGGSAGGGLNVQANGCPVVEGEINGDGNATADGQGGLSGGANGNASLRRCGCNKKKPISASGNASVSAGDQGASVNGDASLDMSEDDCEESDESQESGYSYTLHAERGYTRCLQQNTCHLRHSAQKRGAADDDDQDITYTREVDKESPFWIDGSVSLDDVKIYEIPRSSPISSCEDYPDGTWDDVVVSIFNLGLTKDGTCPVEKGTFPIHQTLPAKTFHFEDKLFCGNYSMTTYADDSEKKWAFEIHWYFSVLENCASSESDK